MFYGYRNNTWPLCESFLVLINTKTHQLHSFIEGISLDILIYLRAEEPRLIKDEFIFRYAVGHGNTDIYDYLKDKIDCNKFYWPLTIGSINILENTDSLDINIYINGSLYKMNYDARAYMIFYAAGLFHKETTDGLIPLAKCKDDKVIHLLEQILEPHLLPENPTSYTDKSSDDEYEHDTWKYQARGVLNVIWDQD